MGTIIGIDIGGSITKIAAMSHGEVLGNLQVRATDPIASLYGALGKYMSTQRLRLGDIEHIMVTGVGSASVSGRIYDIPTSRVDEFYCIGRGGLFTTGLTQGLIVSMGTGTAFVMAEPDSIRHIGGTGVGGGTLVGLSNAILRVRDVNNLVQLAEQGDLGHVDLSIGDITSLSVSKLTSSATASNFGKLSELATDSDIARGLFNMIYQTIAMMAVFAVRERETKDVVLIGSLADIPFCHELFAPVETWYQLKFHLPENAQYVTAIGAALSYGKQPVQHIG